MTDRFPELDEDERRTAARLEQAFARLTHDRPSPATTPAQDQDTAARLAAAFADVTLDAPSPATAATTPRPTAQLLVLPARRRDRLTRATAWLGAAAVAGLVAGVVVISPSGSAAAWAATPRTPTGTDRADIDRACTAPLTRGPGTLQSSGHAAVVGSSSAPGAMANDLPPGPAGQDGPRRLPPLVSLDVRGDLAYAVYQDRTWTVSCLARQSGGGWRDQGVGVGPGSDAPSPGLFEATEITAPGGERITAMSGGAPAGTSRVTFRLADGTQVEASVFGSTWAAWFQDGADFTPDSLTFYDDTGRPTKPSG